MRLKTLSWRLACSGFLVASLPTMALAQDVAVPASAAPKPMSAVDFVELPQLEKPVLSPDGGKLVYVRSHADWSKNKHLDDYVLFDMATGEGRVISDWPRDSDTLSAVSWAPDGQSFAFAMKAKGDRQDQVYIYDLKSQVLSRETAHPSKVGDIMWGRDGNVLYFRARRENPDPAALRKLQIKPYDTELPYELWRHDRRDGLTHLVRGGDMSVTDYTLSRDGTKILLTLVPDGAQYDSIDRELWLFDIATAAVRRLTHNRYAESRAQLSPDNKSFAYIATVNAAGEGYYEDNLFVQKVGDTAPRLMMADVPMEVNDFAWAQAKDSIMLLGNVGLRNALFKLSVPADRLEQLTRGDHAIGDWRYDATSQAQVAVVTDAASPGEVMVKRAGDSDLRPVTHEYANLSRRFQLPRQQAFRWQGRDGQSLEGLLVYPVNYKAGQRFPLITITHGGPRSSSQFGSWNMSRSVPVFTGQGYGVFLPNHRGGTGYGDAFMRDMVGRYFNNAHLDVLDGVDALVARGLADPDRLIAMGWSAGGHMTNKLITMTDRFKAASSGGGVADWISLYGESDVRENRTPWFGGSPWQENAPMASYSDQSILKDAWRVKTPTLFFNGEKDERVPPTQAIMMYRGVRAAGAPTMLYLGEGEPHNFRKLSNQLFKINAELDWFARHVTGTKYELSLPATATETAAASDD
ncbi:MAG: S9 family peptidase [Sphingopyxis sp.]|uniref:S9 family peptidase n=1 Tax=Sphingopyxis sp. TaxID=1908224 RepID=UPI002ABB7E41|nr:S9 family peptidase [Sphingopyxis sp.]MDZ3833293.1 S9 family peptidase [Sphingopyxis sp.]